MIKIGYLVSASSETGFLRPDFIFYKPWDIPAYLLSLGGLVILAKFGWPLLNNWVKNWPKFYQQITGVLLGSILLWSLGSYPMSDFDPQQLLKLAVVWAYLLGCLGVYKFSLWMISRLRESTQLVNGEFWSVLAIVSLLVAVLTFHPGFPVSVFDYSYFLGPAKNIANGAAPFIDVFPQYGVIMSLLMAFLESSWSRSLLYLPVIVWLFYILEYTVVAILVYGASSSKRLSILSVLSLFTIHYLGVVSLPFAIPQAGPIRWLPLVLTVPLSLVLLSGKRKSVAAAAAILGFLTWWSLDTGIGLSLSLGLLAIIYFIKNPSKYRQIFEAMFWYLFFTLGVAGLIAIGVWWGYGELPNLGLLFSKLSQYSRLGFGMLPFPSRSFFWLLPVGFLVSVRNYFESKSENKTDQLILAAGVCSMLAASYFMGRSHVHNLINVAPFFILLVFMLVGKYFKEAVGAANYQKYILAVLAILFVVFPAFARQQTLVHHLKEKVGRLEVVTPYLPSRLTTDILINYERSLPELESEYAPELQLLKNYTSAGDKVILLSVMDTYLWYFSERRPLLDANPLASIIHSQDLERALSPLEDKCPQQVFIDPRCLEARNCHPNPVEGVSVTLPQTIQAFFEKCGSYKQLECSRGHRLCVFERE